MLITSRSRIRQIFTIMIGWETTELSAWVFKFYQVQLWSLAFQEPEYTHQKMYISLPYIIYSRESKLINQIGSLLIIYGIILIASQTGRKMWMSFHAYKTPAYRICKHCTDKTRNNIFLHGEQWIIHADVQILKDNNIPWGNVKQRLRERGAWYEHGEIGLDKMNYAI